MWYRISPTITLIMVYLLISTDAVALIRAHFGAGFGTIYLANVGCTGSENNLNDCSRSTTVSCLGGHLEDAGVRCQGLEKWCTVVAFWVFFFVLLKASFRTEYFT